MLSLAKTSGSATVARRSPPVPLGAGLRRCNVTRQRGDVLAAARKVAAKAKLPAKQAAKLPAKGKKAVVVAKEDKMIDLIIPVLGWNMATVSMSTFFIMQVVVLLAQLGLADAAYSGDWVRIGIITPEVESILKWVVNFILAAHTTVAVCTGLVAQQRGLDAPLAVVKGFFFGTMGLYEILQEEPSTA